MVFSFHVDLTTTATEMAPTFLLVPTVCPYNVQRIIRLVWLISLDSQAGHRITQFRMQAVVSLIRRMDTLFSSSMSTSYKQSPRVLTEIHVPGAKKELPSKLEWFSFPSRFLADGVTARWFASATKVQALLSHQRSLGADCGIRVPRTISEASSPRSTVFPVTRCLTIKPFPTPTWSLPLKRSISTRTSRSLRIPPSTSTWLRFRRRTSTPLRFVMRF